jgi:hypothetical protein
MSHPKKHPAKVKLIPGPTNPPDPKRDNNFSQSRDVREDRGTRKSKLSHNPQTFPHVR